jgi:hypothetical protein
MSHLFQQCMHQLNWCITSRNKWDIIFISGMTIEKRVEAHIIVSKYRLPYLVLGSGPTQSTITLLKDSSKEGTGRSGVTWGALERFPQTLANMMNTYCLISQKDLDDGIYLPLFTVMEAFEESLDFNLFELVLNCLNMESLSYHCFILTWLCFKLSCSITHALVNVCLKYST